MERVRRVTAVLVLALVVLMLTTLPTSAAATTTTVWQVDLTVPVLNRTILGTLTTVSNPATGQGTWSFQGTIDGQLAQAAGSGTFSGSSSSAAVTLTAIDRWSVPGMSRPVSLPATVSLRMVGNLAYVTFHGHTISFTGLPLAISPAVSFPPRASTYVVSMAGAGSQTVSVLPKAGQAAPNSSGHRLRSATLSWFILAGLLAAGVGAGLALFLDHRRTIAP